MDARPERRGRDAALFDEILHERLDLVVGTFPAEADFVSDLRIPRAELLGFYEAVAESMAVGDLSVLERCRTYGEMKRVMGF